ncbi:MAG: hypothetical protein R3B06_18330 [Kofleriaceae bacterium]
MSRRAVRAVLCAAAAIALILAAVTPWWRSADPDDDVGRANVTLIGGEACTGAPRVTCQALSLAGRPGLRDDAFAWSSRVTFGGALVVGALALALAFAGGRPRPLLGPAAAAGAAAVAASGATTVAIASLPRLPGIPTTGAGLELTLVGAGLLVAAAAWPREAGGAGRRARRWAWAGAVVGAAMVHWITLASRSWWHAATEFGTRTRSPLGIEVCDLGRCGQSGNGAAPLGQWALLALAAAAGAAALIAALGLATRLALGAPARRWAWAAAIAAGGALATAGAALAVPVAGAHVAAGAWIELAALAASIALAVIAARTATDAAATATGASIPRGPRPVLAPLGAGAAGAPTPAPPRAPTAPPAIAAYAPALSPAPRVPGPAGATTSGLGPRPSPYCPTCRGATLWHGKRAAWWCSACKHTL